MKERIKQLWIRAAREDSGDKWDSQEEFIERFAELIVRECVNEVEGLQISKYTSTWDIDQHWNRAIAHTTLHLKQHFGVKE